MLDRSVPAAKAVALQQTAIGDYRQEVINALVERLGTSLQIFVGPTYFDATTTTRLALPANTARVRNRFLFGRRLAWQHGVVRALTAVDSAIVEFNPRIVSCWVILVARRLMRRHTVLWGHAWSRKGESSATDRVRQVMRRLSTVVLVYTETERAELERRMPGHPIIAAPNALYRRRHIDSAPPSRKPCTVLYVGRMVASKKPCLLVEAFLMATEADLPRDIRLVMIGDGPELSPAQRLAQDHQNGDRVAFLGHIAANEVSAHYERALISASPGYVGLSVIQSISFGVPMIIARDEPHAPEIEAVEPGLNAVVVSSDAADVWAAVLMEIASAREEWVARRAAIAADCRERYSVELMVERILEAAIPPAVK